MRISVVGLTPAAALLRSYLRLDPAVTLTEGRWDLQVTLESTDGPCIELDGVDGPFEAKAQAHIARLSPQGSVLLKLRAGRNFSDRELIVAVPAADEEVEAAARGLFRAILDVAMHQHTAEPLTPKRFWQR